MCPAVINAFPGCDLRKRGAKLVHARQQGADVRRLQVGVERGFTRPVFVEEKFDRILGRGVQVVVEATRFLARGREQAGEGGAQLGFLTGAGLKRGDDSQCFNNSS